MTGESLRTAVEAAMPHGSTGVTVSGAARPDLLAALEGRVGDVRPVVRGRTVWAATAGDPVAVFESPNGYGLAEQVPAAGAVVLVTEEGSPVPGGYHGTVLAGRGRSLGRAAGGARPDPGASFRARTASADALARHLVQIRGVHLAFGLPESPTFVVVVPGNPRRVAAALAYGAPDLDVDAPSVPGVPGAVRIAVAVPGRAGSEIEWSALCAQAVGAGRGMP